MTILKNIFNKMYCREYRKYGDIITKMLYCNISHSYIMLFFVHFCVVWILCHVHWFLWIELWPAVMQHLPHVPLSFKHQLAGWGCMHRSQFCSLN